jgi:hypothetical protein
MSEDDILIPLAKDRFGNLVSPDETGEETVQYCPNCGERVFPRKGTQRRHHFAHTPNNPLTRDCELRIESWRKEVLQKLQEPELEATIRLHSIRLGVRRHPYLNELELVGLIPVATPSEWEEWSRSGPTLHTIGTVGTLTLNAFHPSHGRVEIALDPHASQFEVEIRDAPQPLGGIWKATWSAPWPRFVGTPYFAEAKENLGRLSEGDTLYLPDSVEVSRATGEKMMLAQVPYRVIGITRESVVQLDAAIGAVGLDTKRVDFRIILPPLHDPNDLVSIHAPPTSNVLVYMLPGRDFKGVPSVEIVELPHTLKGMHYFSGGGGSLQEWSFSVPDGELRRFDMYWSGRHSFLQAFGDSNLRGSTVSAFPDIGLTVTDLHRRFVRASFDAQSPIRVARTRSITESEPRFQMVAPEGFYANITYESADQTGRVTRTRRKALDGKRIPGALEGALRAGAYAITIRFGLFGEVRLECRANLQSQLDPAFLRARVCELGLPRKVRWKYVRALLSTPERTPHEEFPAGLKKRVRAVVAELRRTGECDKRWIEES